MSNKVVEFKPNTKASEEISPEAQKQIDHIEAILEVEDGYIAELINVLNTALTEFGKAKQDARLDIHIPMAATTAILVTLAQSLDEQLSEDVLESRTPLRMDLSHKIQALISKEIEKANTTVVAQDIYLSSLFALNGSLQQHHIFHLAKAYEQNQKTEQAPAPAEKGE